MTTRAPFVVFAWVEVDRRYVEVARTDSRAAAERTCAMLARDGVDADWVAW